MKSINSNVLSYIKPILEMFRKLLTSTLCISLLLAAGGCEKNDSPEPEPPRTTVIVYMAADNDLEEFAKDNIDQMEEAVQGDHANLLVYLNTPGESPRVYRIGHDTEPGIRSETVLSYQDQNAASPEVMKKVLEDIRAAYPSDSYGLILWSHATSWMPPGTGPRTLSFGEDEGNEMDIRDMEDALPGTYEYIIFDACSMASAEVVYQLREKTDYILASPTETIASGMPYHRVTPFLFEGSPGLQKVADTYVDYYDQQDGLYRSATVSLIDTRQIAALAAATRQILENASFSDPDYNRQEVQRLDFEDPPVTEGYDLLDFFQKNFSASDIAALNEQLEKTVLFKQHTSEFLGKPIDAFCGLSCYIPHAGEDNINNYYKALEWTTASGFDLLIK